MNKLIQRHPRGPNGGREATSETHQGEVKFAIFQPAGIVHHRSLGLEKLCPVRGVWGETTQC